MGRSSSIHVIIAVLFFSFIAFSVATEASLPASPAVNIVHAKLKAPWTSTSLLQEASEYLSESSGETSFWSFLDTITASSSSSSLNTPKAQHDFCLTNFEGDKTLFSFALALRLHSPRVQMQKSVAQEALLSLFHSQSITEPISASTIAVLNNDKIFTSIESLQTALDELASSSPSSSQIHPWDHIHPSSPHDSPIVTLYTDISSTEFRLFHSLLSKHSTHIRYVLRHWSPSSTNVNDNPMYVQGYGVELAIKNMEYKAINEETPAPSASSSESVSESSEPSTSDLSAPISSKNRLSIAEAFTLLPSFLSNSNSNSNNGVLEVAQLSDLGLQSIEWVTRFNNGSDPLFALSMLSSNFPQLAPLISRLSLSEDKKLREDLNANHRLLHPSSNFISINHRLIDTEKLNLFSLFQLLQHESNVMSELTSSLHLSPSSVRHLLYNSFTLDDSSSLQSLSSLVQNPRILMSPSTNPEATINAMLLATPRFDLITPLTLWANDLESDEIYTSNMPRDLKTFLQSNWYGQPRFVARNLFNAVFVVDPGTSHGLKIWSNLMALRDQGAPVRMGVLPVDSSLLFKKAQPKKPVHAVEIDAFGRMTQIQGQEAEEDQSHDLSVSQYILRTYYVLAQVRNSKETALHFLSQLAASCGPLQPCSLFHVESVATQFGLNLATDVRLNTDAEQYELDVLQFVESKGISESSLPLLSMNGLLFPRNTEVDSLLVRIVMSETNQMRQLIRSNKITSTTPNIQQVSVYPLGKEKSTSTYQRFHPSIFGSNPSSPSSSDGGDGLQFTSLSNALFKGSKLLSRVPNIVKSSSLSSSDTFRSALVILAVDLDTERGATALNTALEYIQSDASEKVRLKIIQTGEMGSPLSKRIASVLKPRTAEDTDSLDIESSSDLFSQLQNSAAESSNSDEEPQQQQQQQRSIRSDLNLPFGCNVIIFNGRTIDLNAVDNIRGFTSADWKLLERYEFSTRIQSIESSFEGSVSFEGVDADDITNEFRANVLAASASLLAKESASGRPRRIPSQFLRNLQSQLRDRRTAFISTSSDQEQQHQLLEVIAVLDPVSLSGARMTPLLTLLRDHFGASVRVYLNPPAKIEKLPLRSFYRQVIQLAPAFTDDEGLLPPIAEFHNLPRMHTYTMGIDAPEHWLVETHRAVHDLDNIRLLSADEQVDAEYMIQSLLVEGSCLDSTQRQPPRGLQLNLGRSVKEQPHVYDTLVMSNFGYFQLKALPGVWRLSLAPGRASDLYTLDDVSSVSSTFVPFYAAAAAGRGSLSPATSAHLLLPPDEAVQVPVASWEGQTLVLKVKKRPGFELEELLDVDSEGNERQNQKQNQQNDDGVWSKLRSFFGGSDQDQEPKAVETVDSVLNSNSNKTVHVFSIASGHLYERFLKIMMLSVVKSTRAPVRFWFVSNFLSPEFKDSLPKLAQQYGCEVELVTYKWPSWLHRQTEKQRIIWAYKVLFLDVLFPLEVERIIFVDADQVVRADLSELRDMDMHGAPLGYTPFCDSRPEMDGFRFWKQGFWRDHLRGKPYHISALYVVDLKRFRAMAAGDQLRMYYDNLSKDPNSLSNLDQDLPNYAQHVVPIFSLPQEWLWCETWCSDESKSRAKTIDLCNNPLTKTPKLDNAKRIISEWTALDEEAAAAASAAAV